EVVAKNRDLNRSTVQPAWRGLVPLAARVFGSKRSRGRPEEESVDDWPQQAPRDDADRQQGGSRSSKTAHPGQPDAKAPQRRGHGFQAGPAVALAMMAGFVVTDQPAYLIGREDRDAAPPGGSEIPTSLAMALQQQSAIGRGQAPAHVVRFFNAE